jgi:hypothetical protein
MAQKKFFVDINLNKNQLINARLENINSSGVASPAAGQIIFDTSDAKLKYWDGGEWQSAETRFDGALQYKGTIAHNAPAASGSVSGDLYVFNSSGLSPNYGNVVVETGDFTIYNGSAWDVIQGNTVYATTTGSGVVRLSTNNETITGTDATIAVTPASLTAWAGQTDKTVVRKRVYSTETISTTPIVLTHGLGTNEVQVQVYSNSSGEIIEVSIAKGSGTVTLVSNVAVDGTCTVIISG